MLNVSGGTKEIWGTTLQNGGTVNLNPAAGNDLQISNGGNFNNAGTINFNDNVGIAPRGGFGPGTFNNVGGTLAVAAGKTGSGDHRECELQRQQHLRYFGCGIGYRPGADHERKAMRVRSMSWAMA